MLGAFAFLRSFFLALSCFLFSLRFLALFLLRAHKHESAKKAPAPTSADISFKLKNPPTLIIKKHILVIE
jgi:heme/copper-type cytochrome/quinol oxidase subunit 3